MTEDVPLVKESAIGLPDLEHTFDEIAEAFVFFDRNKDGYVSKKEMIWAINEASPSGRQGHKIGVQRFGLLLTSWNCLVNLSMLSFAPFNERLRKLSWDYNLCRGNGLGQRWHDHIQGVFVRLY